MSRGIASLHKILKDETRQRILLVLQERGSITYTDIMNAVGIQSTGKLNYHLKMLNGLTLKKENNQYSLTEKGKLAIRLMEEFCERKSSSEQYVRFPRGYYILVGLFSAVFLTLELGFFISGIIYLQAFVEYIATTVLGIVFLVVAEQARRRRAMSKPSSQMLGAKLSLIFAGAFGGGVILFFIGGLVIGWLKIWIFGFDSWIIASLTIGSIIGGFIGYWIYKKSKLSKFDYYTPF